MADVIPPKEYTNLEISKNGDILEFKNNYNGKFVYFKLGPKISTNANANNIINYSYDKKDFDKSMEIKDKFVGSFNKILKDINNFSVILNYLQRI